MTDKEKVLHGLDSCGFYDGVPNICDVTECPYRDGQKIDCVHKLAHDAGMLISELLKEREPRVLTLEEIKDYDKPIWVDEKGWGSWKLPFYAFDLDLYVIFGHECFLIGDYGKEWLPWTSQPTDEQRKAVKWE